MNRFFVQSSAWNERIVVLSPEEDHHFRHVLRGRVGDSVELFDGSGDAAIGQVDSLENGHVTITVRETRRIPRPKPELTLIQAVIKSHHMDWLLQKATELGVSRIVPVDTEHVVVRLKPKQMESKVERWRKIVLNAAKQCGTPWLPEVMPPRPLSEYLDENNLPERMLVCSLSHDARDLHSVLDSMHNAEHGDIGIFIGPEGSLTYAEEERLRGIGATPVSLGANTLRAETAAIYALSALTYELRKPSTINH
ncbi:MAG: 16S rRNA (uracil(1498)-N(3))-methyltransferase [Verrucomicrobia bacterium]|nr:16S rRNA (uracil(1498)-N(3))-methyltransferase [Verrucomicrobiota bacterium]